MKLKEAVSWLKGTLQRNLFPGLEECYERPLTGKERTPAEHFNSRLQEGFQRRRDGAGSLPMGTGESAYFYRGSGGELLFSPGVVQESARLGAATEEKNPLREDIL
jgi:hypothetical protein